jgi:cobalt-zinc-cadmium efflux system membrane fusion protein
MSSPLTRIGHGIVSQIPTLLILAILAGLAVWGARNDWKIPRLVDRDDETEAAEDEGGSVKVTTTGAPGSASRFVEFPSKESVEKAGIRVRPAELMTITSYVSANGTLDYEPSLYAQLASRAPGTVWSVEKEIGDEIKKGDVLAIIESAEVGRAKADLVQDLTRVDTQSKTLERLQSATGAVSGSSVREAEAALKEARIRLFNDQQRLLNLGLAVKIQDLEALPEDQLMKKLRLLGLPKEVARHADTETLTANLLPLRAPFDGQVVERRTAPGEAVTTERILFTVADVRNLHIDLDVHLEDMSGVHVGQEVTFIPEAKGVEQAKGRVSHISPEVDEKTRHVRVHAEASNANRRLRPHTFGLGKILVGQKARAIVVPTEAIQWDKQTSLVFVKVSETSFRAQVVQVGLHQDDKTEVAGIQPGEMIVTTQSFALKSELRKEEIGGED